MTDMRNWGLVDPSELRRTVVISPHLDDAVLSCAHLLARWPGSTVLTVFAGAPAEYPAPVTRWDALAGFTTADQPLAARRQEDTRALATLDASAVWLDFVEHQYLDRSAWVQPDAIVETLDDALRALDPTAVLVPFGLGNPDHACTHDAAMRVREGYDAPAWFCYEDTGYKHIPGLLAWRVAQLFRAGLWPTPAAPPVDLSAARKRAALAHYESQMKALDADWELARKLAAPAAEQYWRLAPPPPGWERLSRAG